MHRFSILVLCPRLPSPPTDGGAQYVFYCAKALAERGHRIQFACFLSPNHTQDEASIKSWASTVTEPLPSSAFFLAYSFIKSLLTRLPAQSVRYSPKKAVEKLLGKVTMRPDVILLEGVHTAEWIPAIKKRFGNVPVILRESNVEWELLTSRARYATGARSCFWRWQAGLMKRFETRALQTCDGFTAISTPDLHKLQLLAQGKPGITARPGINAVKTIQRHPLSNKVLLLGDFTWTPNRDGLNWFLDAVLPRINHRSLIIDVVGRGLEPREQRSGNTTVVFHGFVDALTPFQEKAAVQVIPILGGAGIKLKSLEALYSKIPTVMSVSGAEGLDLVSRQHTLITDDPSEFATHLLHVIDSAEIQQKLSVAGYDHVVERFSWSETAKELDDFIQTFLSRS